MKLPSRHRSTLDQLFAQPVRADLAWMQIEMLLAACGAHMEEGRGSRIRVELNGVRAVFHRPHPRKDTDKGAVRSVRRFLVEAGIKP